MDFAVKGEVLLKANELAEELKKGKKLKFSELIYTNQGDCHALGQPPITFLRQVLAVCVYPQLFNNSRIPGDVKRRAKTILSGCLGSSMGSYTDSQGIFAIRKHIADYITKRDDGIESKPENIFITDGASPIVRLVLSLFCHEVGGKPSGVLIPIPNYPLYSASLTQLGLYPAGYYLDEEKNWGLNIKQLKKHLEESKCYCTPRAIVVINPGNPTGQVLTRKNIEDVIKFASREKLVIFADEVYQENIYDTDSEFHSFKKVKHEMGPPYNEVELISFISVSKGYTGECGLRGGCAELDCIDKEVQAMAVKSASVLLCSNTVGQAALSVLCKPPEEGDESYEEFIREKCCILNGLANKATLVADKINKIDGLKVNPVQGALYAFVKIDMPENAIKGALKKKLSPDGLYAFELLEETGIVTVPGSGFGQKPGSFHFRTTILPPFEKMEVFMNKLKKFQSDFMKKYK
ncbi:alanine aminotransferase 2-like [Lycorma delicatula]|uniref:alanine aminotransferase 2-like n=1 Tax=Lycorma delicatula TaxID=130591 RepID=UPI003F519A6B